MDEPDELDDCNWDDLNDDETCWTCGGDGMDPNDPLHANTCPCCDGTGLMP